MSDNIFVSRDNNIYQINMESSGSLRDTDLVLASREVNGVPTLFKVTGDKFGKAPAAPAITAVVLQQDNTNANRFTSNSFTSIVAGNEESPTAPTLMAAEVEGALSIEASTEPIATNAYSASTETSVPLTLDGTFNLGDLFEVGDVVLANESYTPVTDTISSVGDAVYSWSGDWVGATARTGGIWSGGGDVNAMFNGSTDVYSPGSNGAYATITFDPPIPCSTLEIRANTSNQSVDGRLKLNGIDYGGATRAFPPGGGVTTAATVWTTIPNAPETISTLQIGWTGSWIATSGIRIDGTELRQGIPLEVTSPNKLLTLPTEKDIQLFQTGDIVQGTTNTSKVWTSYGSGTPASAGYDWSKAFGGTRTASFTTAPDLNNAMDWEYPSGLITNGDLALALGVDSLSNSCTCTINLGRADQVTVPVTFVNNVGGAVIPWVEVNNIPVLYSIQLVSDSNIYIYLAAVRVNNLQLADNGVVPSDSSSVISTDVSAKTITVDGGNWDTSNQSQVWSSGTKTGSPYSNNTDWDAAFNGDITASGASAAAGSTYKLALPTPIPITNTTNITYYCLPGASLGLTINDVPLADTTPGTVNNITGADISGSEIESLTVNAGVTLCGLAVDGKLLVDAVNDSQVWSSTATWSPSQPPVGQRAEDGFNGTTSSDDGYFYAVTGGDQTVTFSDLEFTTLEIWTWQINDASVFEVTGNGTAVNLASNINNDPSSTSFPGGGFKFDATSLVTSPLQSIKVTKASSSTSAGFTAVFVDGKLLVDQSVRDLGDTKVSTISPKRGEGTIKTINGAAVTIEPFTDNCFKEDQYLVFKTPKVIEVTPLTDPVGNFNSQTNTLTLTGDKDLSQLANGDTIYMTDGTEPVNQDAYLLTTSNITSIVDNTVNSIDMVDRSKSGTERNDYPFTNFFDGNFSTFYYMGPGAVGLYLDIDIPAGSTVELYGNNGASDTQTITVRYNDGATTGSFLKSSASEWRDCSPEDQTIAITSMFIETVGDYGGWNALRINGEIVGTTYSSPTELTFADPCTDLQYFKLQDVVQTSPEIKVLDIDAANRTMKVTPGGDWDTSNQSQVWSNGSFTGTMKSEATYGPWTYAFDGVISASNYAEAQDESVLTLDNPIPIAGKTVEVWAAGASTDASTQLWINNIPMDLGGLAMGSTSWTDNTAKLSGQTEITSIRLPSAGGAALGGIRVGGRLLVDAAIDSQVWSSQVTGTAYPTNINVGPFTNLFDGDPTTYTAANTDSWCSWTPPSNSTYEIYFDKDNGAEQLQINGQPYAGSSPATGANLNLVRWNTNSSNQWVKVSMIKLDGKVVLDAGIRNIGDSKITYQTNGGQGTVDTVDVGNNSIVIVPTGDRDNRWIGTNQEGTVFRAGSPTKPAISQKAYLKFTGAGIVESISAAPVAPQAMTSRNPTLIFPAEFDTNTTPDAELPNPTSLKTTISRTNELGSSTASSNKLFPTTTTRSDLTAGAAATFTTDGYAEFVCMALSHEGRAAEQRAIQHAENCQALKDAAEQKAQDYINDNP